jgi:hypothetical protein
MPGGIRDSSKTRVVPVFSALSALGGDWVRRLLPLVGPSLVDAARLSSQNLTFVRGHWGEKELGMRPPVSLLSWLIRNPTALKSGDSSDVSRQELLRGDPDKVEEALALLRSEARDRAWYIFEGPTFPDVVIETPDALVVVEGKRTEAGPTTDTTWLTGRHQIWRHIDAAWERRGRRAVFGMFIVEGTEGGAVPKVWRDAVSGSVAPSALECSFPHRSSRERQAIASCLLGVTTWQKIVSTFALPPAVLLDRVQ